MLIDTHAHVNFNAFREDGDEVVRRSLTENTWLINVGSQLKTAKRAVEYANRYPEGVFAAVGLHPIHLSAGQVQAHVDEFEDVKFSLSGEEFDEKAYRLLAQKEKVVAIGEIGLDYYRIAKDDEKAKEKQKEIFIKQLNLAKELGKPVIIHCREAHNEVLEILKKEIDNKKQALRGVVHSFSGRWSQAQEYMNMGFYLGFNGIITFARDYDRVVKEMPLEKLLLETDCPYLTPEPFRGKRNEPSYVKYVAEKVAHLRRLSAKEVAETTTKNARVIFKI